jgi:hypothetical protein
MPLVKIYHLHVLFVTLSSSCSTRLFGCWRDGIATVKRELVLDLTNPPVVGGGSLNSQARAGGLLPHPTVSKKQKWRAPRHPLFQKVFFTPTSSDGLSCYRRAVDIL